MRRRTSDITTHANRATPAKSRTPTSKVFELAKRSIRSLTVGWDHFWTAAGARTVAGVETVVLGAATLFAGEAAGPLTGACCTAAPDRAGFFSGSGGSAARVSA